MLDDRLPSLEGTPAERRASVVRRLARLVPSDYQALVGIAEANGAHYYDSVTWAGDSDAGAGWDDWTGAPFISLWDPRSPRAGQVNRFQPGAFDGISREERQRAAIYRGIYEPWGLEHQLRILVYDDRRCVGWLGALRHRGSRCFDRDSARRADRSARWLVTAVVAAARAEDLDSPRSGSLIFRPDGTMELASRLGADWLTPERRACLATNVRALDSGGASGSAVVAIEGTCVRFVRLVGDGPTRYLGMLGTASRPTRSRTEPLTPRQRSVAELAAAGATRVEIGQHLGISPETVKRHLKAIYRRLDVANRLELADALRD